MVHQLLKCGTAAQQSKLYFALNETHKCTEIWWKDVDYIHLAQTQISSQLL
jgi:hypothetical protein